MNLTLARVVGLLAALGAGITAFTGAATSSGGYKGAIVAALSAVVLTWLHEEHSTERNATTAAASMTPAPTPVVHPGDVAAASQAVAAMLGAPAAPTAPAQPAAPTAPAQPAGTIPAA